MDVLNYHTSCANSRYIRILLDFTKTKYKLHVNEYWTHSLYKYGIQIIPSITIDSILLEGYYPLIEHIIGSKKNFHLLPNDTDSKKNLQSLANIRKMLYLLNEIVHSKVTSVIVYEKFIRLLKNEGSPDLKALKSARKKLSFYIDMFSKMILERGFLFYDKISLVDIALAAQISILDYFGEISWIKYTHLAEWYRIIKSLPEFNKMLSEKIGSFIPPKHYKSLDF